MGDTTTAIRDPIFFRWHKFIDDTFVLHKKTLAPYEEANLRFNSVVLDEVSVSQVGKIFLFFSNCLKSYYVLRVRILCHINAKIMLNFIKICQQVWIEKLNSIIYCIITDYK